jgi:GDP-D-mannose dehydratase
MNLVIGASSQIAHYLPDDYIKISSRNIDFNFLTSNKWNAVYLPFSEQRIYDANIDYITPNYIYTLQIINTLLPYTDKIVCYTSCELWNNLTGFISTNTPPSFSPITNEYCISKLLLWNKIIELRKIDRNYEKVIFIHPFYFNSVYRSEYFLFGKIFNSILNKQKIQVGNLDFDRDMVHTKFVAQKSIEAKQDTMVGAGRLFNVKQFVQDIYRLNGLDFNSLVEENNASPIGKPKLIKAKVDWDYTYQDILYDTQNDLMHRMQ